MARVMFTRHLRGVAPDGEMAAAGATVGDVLAGLFAQYPQLGGYVLDEQGALRKHVCIFADGERLQGESALRHAIGPDAEIYVMQALSGG